MKSVQPFRRVKDVLLYENEPVFLAGCLPGNPDLPEPVETKLQMLETHRNNFWRHWMIAYYLYCKGTADSQGNFPPDHDGRARKSPFLYDRTAGRWDLTRFNDDYFRRLRATIEAAAARGIVVEISLFDSSGLSLAGRDGKKRWPHNPFNAANNKNQVIAEDPNDTNVTGFPEWFRNEPRLRSIQAAYVRKVVREVKDYWNVTFEIMNEPRDTEIKQRVEWGDFIASTIVAAYGATPRKQLIFWNSYPPNGDDVEHWRAYPNYSKIDGVTFHGDPHTREPDSDAYLFRDEKVFQASADAGPEGLRNEHDWNRRATNHCSSRDMIFQAWSTDELACRGVGDGQPPPSPLLEPALLYNWRKVAEDPPSLVPDNFDLRFFADRSFLTYLPEPYQELGRGFVKEYLGGRRLVLYNATSQTEIVWHYELTAGGTMLRLVRESDQFRQDFTRLRQATPESLDDFLYHWRKISETPPSPVPDDFHLRFHGDGSTRTFFVNPSRPLGSGEVRLIQGDRMTLLNREGGKEVEWSYTLSGTQLKIVRIGDNFTQVFERFPRPAGDHLVPLLYRWDRIAGVPANVFRLRFFADGSFVKTQTVAPYAELERGEVRAFAPQQGTQAAPVPGRLTLWSHTKSTQTVYDVWLKIDAANDVKLLDLTNQATGEKQTFRRA